ncbi:hypothetical protein [Pseudonocardia sp. GCM10023141]|uniref:hypothetical protein n=1 Tax=Pseudonocardia sp. GCM10023141 TaxID=3252653 RepID=UPI003611612E
MDVFARLVNGWRRWLLEQLADWNEEDRGGEGGGDLATAIDSFAERIIDNGRVLTVGRHAAL